MYGTRNENDEVHVVQGFDDWSDLPNNDTNGPNGTAFYFPRFEYYCQILNFFLAITLVKVIERIAVLALIVTFSGWLLGLWNIDLSGSN